METKTSYEIYEQYMGRWNSFLGPYSTIGEAETELDRAYAAWPNHIYAIVKVVTTKTFLTK